MAKQRQHVVLNFRRRRLEMHLYYIFKYSICKHAYFTHLLLYVAYSLFGVIGPAEEEGQGDAPAPSGRGEGRKEAQGVGEAPATL